MFCSECGVDLTNDSQFCRKCGQAQSVAQSVASTSGGAAAAVAPARIPTPVAVPQPKRSIRGWIFGGLLLLVVVWIAEQVNWQHPLEQPASAQHQPVQPQPQLHTQSTGNVAFTVSALGLHPIKFTVPAGAFNVNLKGHFAATGGFGNDIQVLVLSEDEYVNWQNGHPPKTLYNSGQVTQESINLTLPSDAATYYVAFNNKSSWFTPRAVQASIDLNFYTR